MQAISLTFTMYPIREEFPGRTGRPLPGPGGPGGRARPALVDLKARLSQLSHHLVAFTHAVRVDTGHRPRWTQVDSEVPGLARVRQSGPGRRSQRPPSPCAPRTGCVTRTPPLHRRVGATRPDLHWSLQQRPIWHVKVEEIRLCRLAPRRSGLVARTLRYVSASLVVRSGFAPDPTPPCNLRRRLW